MHQNIITLTRCTHRVVINDVIFAYNKHGSYRDYLVDHVNNSVWNLEC